MKFSIKSIVNVLFGLIFCQITAQELPPIETYTPQLYEGGNQNWSICQSDDNSIYVANNNGLLEYNGAKWNLYGLPNNSIVRSVKFIDGKVFTGNYMDFGYWEKDEFGALNYISIPNKIGINLLEDEQFWNIEELDGFILFRSLSRIYIVDLKNNTSRFIESDVEITKMLKVDGSIFFQKLNKGIFKLVNGNPKLISDASIFKENRLINIFLVNNKLLFLTEENGIYYFKNDLLVPWNFDDRIDVNSIDVYSATQLNDKSIILGTISNGIIHLKEDGSVMAKLNFKKGLSNNTVLSIFEDHQNNIWLGLDNGINCINLSSKFRIYNDTQGSLGTIYTSIVHKGLLYLGTNQGLFYKNREDDGGFKFIQGSNGQVWMLKEVDNTLFCGHNNGTFIIKNGNIVQTINESIGTWDFKLIKNSPNHIIQGNYNGLSVLEKVQGKWVFKNKIKGFDISSRFFVQTDDKLFVNHEIKGFYELELDSDFKEVKKSSIVNSVTKGIGSSVIEFSGNYIYSSFKGVFFYDSTSNTFNKDEELSNKFSSFENVTTLMEIKGSTNELWRYVDDNILVLSQGSISAKPKIKLFPISRSFRNTVAGFENITKINEDEYLIGTSYGYLILNNSSSIEKEDFEIKINSIEVNEIDEPKIKLSLNNQPVLKNKRNNFEFSYSVATYNKLIKNKYRYQLLGLSDNWSDWTTKPKVIFENLPFGDYTFNVNAKVGNNSVNKTATYSFTIERPWLLSNIMILFYVLAFIIFSILTHTIYKRYYKKQRERLMLKSQRELELKELENEQQLMHFKNEKLEHEIESKNRELAISTMSIIKKNEFLNSIKNELKKIDDNSLNSVIKMLNNNLNNTDDWKFFEEAFNNADKDFLKKVKKLHPSLTPNDLKLCAYLRLNLSSKEIAPLLNISSRSVEVKRYRLRKKLNLSHEASLTNYILEI